MPAFFMMRHPCTITLTWTGNRGPGTSAYTAYDRDHQIHARGQSPIEGSADPAFRGDPTRWSPEELFLASIAACHKLWYLHLAAEAGICVTTYEDTAKATLILDADGNGEMAEIVLTPHITISAGDPEQARALHEQANERCFIARSIRASIRHNPQIFEINPT